ncbi:MAG: alpha-L-arabinofuranosidase, partial [Planctomycetota bacterium]
MQRLGHVFGTVVVVCGVCVGVSATAQEAPTNWLKNPSLENAAGDRPAEWQTFTWGGAGSFEYDGVARSGQRSVALSSAQGADLSWGCIVPVDPYARYRLSGYIKTENVRPVRGRGVLLNVHNIQPVATRPMTGTNDWTLVEVEFETGEHDAIQVNCTLGAWGLASGKAWFDDLKLEQIARPHLPAPRITIDAGKVSAPLSPYIYGQFIEHLGRCIYGGIWAELLEDRKFFYPVGGRESPWQPVGGADAVRMQTAGALVGAHTPVVTLTDGAPRGLAQGDLGLVAGQEYVGRIWLAGTPESGPVQVSLVWGAAPAARQTLTIPDLTEEFTKRPLRFTAAASTDDARLEITAAGRGSFRVGTLSLMPADNVQGLRADTLALLKQLNAPIYRWPGGNFVSGYDWRDGIGDPDRRPPRKNPAWEGVEHNDFGIDEFLAFCRILKAEPYITVNSGLGDAAMAAAEVEYVNGAADTPMGQRRAANGHAKPYGVRFWAVGN